MTNPIEIVPEAQEPPPPVTNPGLPALDDGRARRLSLHFGLLLATFLTTTMAGSWGWEGTFDMNAPWRELVDVNRLSQGLTYAVALLAILGAHEMGHYFACRYYGVSATLPFFVPGIPLLIGTFGAVIRIRSRIPSRKALFDIAAAGPIAGFVVALPLMIVGLARAKIVPPSDVAGGLGSPLLASIVARILHGDGTLEVGSIFGAAWVGMLVTSMNLFPVGQLDGGHAVFAIVPRWHRMVSFVTIGAIATLVVAQTVLYREPSAYTLWLVVLLLLRDRHPRLVDESDRLGTGRVALAVVLAVIFVLAFIPMPLSLD